MACGVPIVSTTGGALPEVVGNAGILVAPRDYMELGNAVASVFDNPLLAKKMSQAGILRVKEKFSWANAAKETVKIYEEVLS